MDRVFNLLPKALLGFLLIIRHGGVLLLPPVAGVLLFLVAPEYMKTLFNEALGIAAVIAAGGLAIVGWFWLRKIVDIEV